MSERTDIISIDNVLRVLIKNILLVFVLYMYVFSVIFLFFVKIYYLLKELGLIFSLKSLDMWVCSASFQNSKKIFV